MGKRDYLFSRVSLLSSGRTVGVEQTVHVTWVGLQHLELKSCQTLITKRWVFNSPSLHLNCRTGHGALHAVTPVGASEEPGLFNSGSYALVLIELCERVGTGLK
jgi:hypothetical protein